MSSWKTIFRASLALALLGGGSALAQNPIEVERLEALDPLEVGLPGGALPNRLWAGTGNALAARVLTGLPEAGGDGYSSETVAELARAILVSGGRPPEGARGNSDLALLRVDRLLAASGAEDAFDLLERTPGINRRPGLARWHAELGFALGHSERACRTAEALVEGRDTAYWLRVRAFCLVLQDRAAAAELTAELARGQGEDEGFDARLYALTLDTPLSEDAPGADTGLEWAMDLHRNAGGDDMALHLSADAPAWLRAVAQDAGQEERSEPVADPVAALVAAQGMEGMERHRALEAVLAQGRDREMSARALGLLLADAGRGARFVHVARHQGREIDSLPITAATLEHGYEIALAAVLVGDLRSARVWRDALIEGPPRAVPATPMPGMDGIPADAAKPQAGMPDPLAGPMPEPEWTPPSPRRMVALDLALALAADRMTGGGFEAVFAAWSESAGTAALADRLALARLGAPAGGDALRLALLEAEPAPAMAGPAALDAAVRANAQAEAALLAVAILDDPAAGADPDAFSRAIAALDAVGLRRQALAIMVERVVQRAL